MTDPTDIPPWNTSARFAHAARDSAEGGRPGRASDTPAGAVVPPVGAVVPFPKPHRIDPWRGATAADIAHSREAIDLCFDLFVSAVLSIVEDVRENASFSTKGLHQATKEWAAHLADARQILIDAFSAAEDRAP